MAFKRKKLSYHGAKKYFSRTAGSRHSHPRNHLGYSTAPMRGGIRL